jgi:diguanylate cyclase (GGDEF)-like protein
MTASEHHASVTSESDWELWSIRILLSIVVLGGAIFVSVPGISSRLQTKSAVFPQLLVGFAVLALVLYLHMESQRKLLGRASAALMAANSYVDRLEQFSFVDPQTQLFNRRYLDQLFNQQLRWMNRSGSSATLLLFEVLTEEGQKTAAEEIAVEAAFVLRSNFRGSDYVVRNSDDQFFVLLPDTTGDQAQYALNRLADKIEDWNLENERVGLSLRHELNTCPPGGNFWDKLRELEISLRHKPSHRSELRHFAEARVGPVSVRSS